MKYIYDELRNKIYSFYDNYGEINNDNIQEVNDYIVDVCLNKDDLEDDLDEFYIYTAMCSYMLEKDLYDEYFFKTFEEINNEIELDSKTELLETDIIEIKDYMNKDTLYLKYYDLISNIINSIENGKEVLIDGNKITKENDNIILYTLSNERFEFEDVEEAISSLKINKDNYKKFNIEID